MSISRHADAEAGVFAAEAGQRVDAYAEPGRIAWDMGDGSSPVTCHDPGTGRDR